MPRAMRYYYEKNPVGFIVHFMEKTSTHTEEEAKKVAEEIFQDPQRLAICNELADVFIGPALYPESYETWYNDMDNDQMQIPLENINIPTLIVHGVRDKIVPFSHGQGTAARIPNSQLLALEEGFHILGWHPDYFNEVRDPMVEFMKKHL